MSNDVGALHYIDELEAFVARLDLGMTRDIFEESREVQRLSMSMLTPRDFDSRPRLLPSILVFHHPLSHPRLTQDHRKNRAYGSLSTARGPSRLLGAYGVLTHVSGPAGLNKAIVTTNIYKTNEQTS